MDPSNHLTASPTVSADLPSQDSPVVIVDPNPPGSVPTQPVQSLPAPSRPAANFGSDLISSLQSLMGTVVIAIFVITFIVQAFQIPSESMENTLLVGDYLLVNKLCYGGQGLGNHVMPYQRISR